MNLPHANALALIVFSNILPLIGVLFAGWDVYTLLIFYWCETLIVWFWTVMTIGFFVGETTWTVNGPASRNKTLTGGGAAFIALHAGFFMAIHLFLMSVLYGGDWPGHLRSPLAFFETFMIGEGLWPMLLVVFLHRGAIFLEERRAASVMPTIVGLYLRIVVMQVVIIIGAWGVMLLGSGIPALVLLIGGRVVLDLYWPRLVGHALKFTVKPGKGLAP